MKHKHSRTTAAAKGLPPFYLHEEFKRKFPKMFPEKCVYHYTSSDVLDKFTSAEASIYATHYRALNDDSEYEKGMEYVLGKYLLKCKPTIHRLLKRTFPKLYEDDDTEDNPFLYTPWVTSFSRSPDLLSQWIAYTPHMSGGVAIGFDFAKLEKLIQTSVCVRRKRYSVDETALDYEIHFLPCVYLGDGYEMVNKILDYLFGSYWQKLCISIQDTAKGKEKDKRKAIAALLIANLFAAIAKDASFSSEQEFRLVMLVKNEAYLKKMEFIGGKPRLKVPIEEETRVKINKLISSVTISPHGDRRLLRSVIDFAKHREGLGFSIICSKSPYNGR